jgi:death-on-curing protein
VNAPVFLTIEEVLHIHEREIARQGGSFGVRDIHLLESALAMPEAGFGQEYLHEDIFEMAAAYLFHVVMNHPFVDGNKRAGFAAALAFLDVNGVRIRMSQDAAYDLVIGVCEGTVTKRQVAAALRDNAEPLDEG